jgi:hypothetical protein
VRLYSRFASQSDNPFDLISLFCGNRLVFDSTAARAHLCQRKAGNIIPLTVENQKIAILRFGMIEEAQSVDWFGRVVTGCSKMSRCKAPEILGNEAYLDVRRNDER